MRETLTLLYRHPATHIALIVFLGCVVYINTLDAPFTLDDMVNITQNPRITGTALRHDAPPEPINPLDEVEFSGRSVGYLTFALNYRLSGDDPRSYHLTNLAIHLINAMLLYCLVLLILKTPMLAKGAGADCTLMALIAALLFVAHPLGTQAVTYITQRFASLAAMFCLGSLVCFFVARGSHWLAGLAYFLSVALALLAMKTKEIAFMLPFLIVLSEIAFFRGLAMKRIITTLPFMLLLPVIPITVLLAEGNLGATLHAVNPEGIAWGDYLLTELRVVSTYLRLLALPFNLNIDYDYPLIHTIASPYVLLGALLIAATIASGIMLYRGNRMAAFGVFWFALTLPVESGMMPIRDVIFEHRMYLPSVGLIIASTAMFFRYGRPLLPLLGVFVVFLALAAHERNHVWTDNQTLWEDTARKSPDKARPHSNLGTYYYKAGMLAPAEREFKAAIEADGRHAVARYNLGLIYADTGRYEEAEWQYRAAIALAPADADAHNNLGYLLFKRGDIDGAIKEYEVALRIAPGYSRPRYNLGEALLKMGRVEEAFKNSKNGINNAGR